MGLEDRASIIEAKHYERSKMSEDQKQEKLGAFPYVIGGLSFIPILGVLFGIIAITWGLVTKKLGGKKLSIIGACGISVTIIVCSCIVYFDHMVRGGMFGDLRAQLAETTIHQVVQAIEFYKIQNGTYPDSLKTLRDSLPQNSMVFVHDPTDVKEGGEPRNFYYEVVDEGHYYLLSVGPDGQPFTQDDILPKMEIGQDSKVGLLIKQKSGGYLLTRHKLKEAPSPGTEETTIAITPSSKPAVEVLPEGVQKNTKGFYEIVHPADKSIMVSIPPGEFTMGSNEYSAEKPVQHIHLAQYYIDKYVVTNQQYQEFVDKTQYETDAEKEQTGLVRIGRRWKKIPKANWKMPDGLTSVDGRENHPVSQVSYNDAAAYCKWAGKDLPTEAQWEKAARGYSGFIYPWGNSEPKENEANFDGMVGSTTPVTEYEAGQSPYGLHDMAGNVKQWVKDWYGTGERTPKNPTGPASGKERVIKGGCFIEGSESLRSANRDWYLPHYSAFMFGFRCACKQIESLEKESK